MYSKIVSTIMLCGVLGVADAASNERTAIILLADDSGVLSEPERAEPMKLHLLGQLKKLGGRFKHRDATIDVISTAFGRSVWVGKPPDDDRNKFWRDGARKIIAVCIHTVCSYRPQQANLIEVRRTILDVDLLVSTLERATRNAGLGGDLAIMAKDVLAQSRYLDEFRTGAGQGLDPYSSAGELGRVVRTSTFRWSDLKRQPMTVYLCADLAEQETFQRFLQLFTECALIEILQAPGNRPVHILLDEATNFSFDISKKLTALRGVGHGCRSSPRNMPSCSACSASMPDPPSSTRQGSSASSAWRTWSRPDAFPPGWASAPSRARASVWARAPGTRSASRPRRTRSP